MVKRVILIVGVLAVVVVGALLMTRKGTDAQQLGEPVPPDVKMVRISDILQNPTQFRDALVATEGLIGVVGCMDCGGVIVVEKTWRIPVEPEDPSKFRIPVKRGARIRLWGIVKVRGGETEKSGEKQSAEAEASQVEIKVKGVELR